MSTIPKTTKLCCTCKHFGGKATLKGGIVEYEKAILVKSAHAAWAM